MSQGLIPATILTGFLGSGKTTLLKRVLSESHGQKIAVIENEFGSENIDNDILVQDSREEIIQLNNGCVCCSIREDLRTTLSELAEKKRKGELDFDRVVIETTGLADPGPVAQTFFMDDEIAESYLLDSILTLVDAKHGDGQLDLRQEARRQVGFADQIFISKSDLVAKDEVEALVHRLKHMNPRAPQRQVHFGEVPIAEVFDLRGFNLNAKLDIDPEFLKAVLRVPCRPAAEPGQAGGLSRCDRAGLRPEDAALQGRAAHAGQRPQGHLPGRAPADGQRPGSKVGARRKEGQQDGLHRHRSAQGHPAAGTGAMRVLSSISRRPGRLCGAAAGGARSWRIMMATIRALEPGGRAARMVLLQGSENLFSREFRQGDPN
jgi:G3E family GTPase